MKKEVILMAVVIGVMYLVTSCIAVYREIADARCYKRLGTEEVSVRDILVQVLILHFLIAMLLGSSCYQCIKMINHLRVSKCYIIFLGILIVGWFCTAKYKQWKELMPIPYERFSLVLAIGDNFIIILTAVSYFLIFYFLFLCIFFPIFVVVTAITKINCISLAPIGSVILTWLGFEML